MMPVGHSTQIISEVGKKLWPKLWRPSSLTKLEESIQRMSLNWQVHAANIIWGNLKWARFSGGCSYLPWYPNRQALGGNNAKKRKEGGKKGKPEWETQQNMKTDFITHKDVLKIIFWDPNYLFLILFIHEEMKVLHQTLELKISRIKRGFMLNPLLMDIGSLQETCGRKFSSSQYKWNDFCTCREKHVQRQWWRLNVGVRNQCRQA